MPKRQNAPFPSWLWIVAALVGLGLFILGLVLVIVPLVFQQSLEMVAVVLSGYGLLCVVSGVALSVAGIRGWKQRSSPRFYPRRGWLVFLLAGILLACLAALLPRLTETDVVFSLFHFALIGLPGLFLFSLLSLAAGSDAALSLRHWVVAAVAGASTIVIAVPAELIGLVASAVTGVAATLLFPGGSDRVAALTATLKRWSERPPTDETEILAILASSTVLITLVLTLAVITPVVEELGKTLLLGVMGVWRRPSVVASFLWGAACGLGFAWLEGISNGAIGLTSTAAWLGGVGLRVFATAMHCLTSGVVGLGWGWFWQGHRWRLPLAYAIAIIFHGLWNFAVILGLSGLGLTGSAPGVGYVAIGAGALLEVSLAVGALAGLVGIPLALRKRAVA